MDQSSITTVHDLPVCGVHDGSKIVEYTDDLATMFGYESCGQLLSRNLLDFIDPEHRDQSIKDLMQAGSIPYDSVAVRADGTRFRAQISGRVVRYHGSQARVFFVRDLSPLALVVDDEPLIGNLMSTLLKRLGYRTDTADSADDALRYFRADEFALVVTDIVMPRVDGIELSRRLRAADPTVPILFMSGFAESLALDRHSRFISKPFGFEELLAAIAALPERARAGLV